MGRGVWRHGVGETVAVFFHTGVSPHVPKLSAYSERTARPDASHLGTISSYLPRPRICDSPSPALARCDEISGASGYLWSPWTRPARLLLGPAGGRARGPGAERRGWDLPGAGKPGSEPPPAGAAQRGKGFAYSHTAQPHGAERGPGQERQPRDRRPGPTPNLCVSVFPSVKWEGLTVSLVNKLENTIRKHSTPADVPSSENLSQPLCLIRKHTCMMC